LLSLSLSLSSQHTRYTLNIMQSSFTLLALAFAAVCVADSSAVTNGPNAPATSASKNNAPQLVRRQLDPFNPIGVITGSVGVHKSNTNARMAVDIQRQLDTVERTVERLEATEHRIRSLAQLTRRLIGTAVGAAGIHKSKKLRKQIMVMIEQASSLRNRVNELLEAEGLPVEHPLSEFNLAGKRKSRRQRRKERKAAKHLERRQVGLGFILGPVAVHKANHDRRMLQAITELIKSILEDAPKVEQAQATKMARGGQRPGGMAPMMMRGPGGNGQAGGRRVSITQVHFSN